MSAAAVMLGFLNVILECAVIIFVALVIVWVCRMIGITIDGRVYQAGQVIVGLLCLIVVVSWLFAVLGGTATTPHFLWRW